ncbi:lipopolysaccharide biosynthesis protein [Seongchinamella sediminis]|uniref:Lipopolysaccharide biosynthesis protein n=1 Tax=Seongchinamella sediminis TaxID=2283635 RepID=A0A3L7DT29_9GAMM|nr:lipopolysaccharide biosynthesis protein [Seongchinamella sediminis]RLQ20767.1 lipopolysaccharide biosynthesis protein [Seongchinamella sediminis]
MNLGDTIRGGVRWVVMGKVANHLLQFVLSIILARLLMPSDFGLLVTVQIFTGVAGFIAGGGMGQAIVQSRDLEPRDTHVVFTAQLIICCIIYAIFFMTSPVIAVWFSEPLYEDLMRVSALTFLIRPFSNLPHSLLHRDMRYRSQAFIGLGVLFTTGTVSISLALLGLGVWSLALGGIAGGIINAILAILCSGWRPNFVVDLTVLKQYANYGIKVSLNDIVIYLRNQSSNFTVSRFIGTEAVGLFNKASSLNDMPLGLLSGSAYKVVFRALSAVQDNRDQSKYIYLRTLTLVSTYTLPFYTGLWWIADSFVVNAYGQHWADAAPILKILVLTAVLKIINNQSGAVLAARKLLGRELIIQLLSWALLILAIIVGYHWGTQGVAWAVVAAFIPYGFLIAWLACHELDVRAIELWRAISPALALNVILVLALWATSSQLLSRELDVLSPLYLLAMVFTGGIVYGSAFLFLPISSLQKEAARWKSRLRISL